MQNLEAQHSHRFSRDYSTQSQRMYPFPIMVGSGSESESAVVALANFCNQTATLDIALHAWK